MVVERGQDGARCPLLGCLLSGRRAGRIRLARLVELVVHVNVALGLEPEEVGVHEPLLGDRPDRQRAFDDVTLTRRTSREAYPGAGLEFLATLPEDAVT